MLKLKCFRDQWDDAISVLAWERFDAPGQNPIIRQGQPLVMVPVDVTHTINVRPQPTLKLNRDEAQFFMDQLWDCGLRPSEGSGSAGQLAATQKHLEDMRSLVFKTESKR